MLSERTIINALILLASLIVGPYLAISYMHEDYLRQTHWPLLVAVGATTLLVIFFFFGNRICALPLLGLCFTGKINFLPLGLSAGDMCMFIVIVYYLLTYIALKQKPLKTGPPELMYPIMIIGMIILYQERRFGIHAFGGATEGSRQAVLMLTTVISYVCGINLISPSVAFFRRLPWYCVGLIIISGLPYIITTYAPETANSLIYVSNNINTSAFNGDTLARQGVQASIGAALQTVLLAYFPIYTWWRPERWWVAILSLICLWLAVNGGFRSTMALFGLSFMLGAWCYCSWRSLVILPAVIMAMFTISILHSSNLLKLSMNMQRSLSFVPGSWDPEVRDSAKSSDEFRNAIQSVYLKEYVDKSPIFGNGFAIDVNEFNDVTSKAQTDASDGYYGTKIFIIGKAFHVGWISVYDAVGIIGTAAFVVLGVNISLLSGRFIFGRSAQRQSPLLPLRIWIFCNVTRDMVGFFTVFGNFSLTFTYLCGYAIILAQLREIERKPETEISRAPERELLNLPKLGKPGLGAAFN